MSKKCKKEIDALAVPIVLADMDSIAPGTAKDNFLSVTVSSIFEEKDFVLLYLTGTLNRFNDDKSMMYPTLRTESI
jgi:hypothetical protein